MGGKIDPGWARLGKKIDQLVVYTSLTILDNIGSNQVSISTCYRGAGGRTQIADDALGGGRLGPGMLT